MHNITLIWIAFIIDLILGDPYKFPHPVRYIGKYIRWFEKKFYPMNQLAQLENKDNTQLYKDKKETKINEEKRKNALKRRGMFLVISTITLTFLITFLVLHVAKLISGYLYIGMNIIIMWTCIAHRCLGGEGYKIYRHLKNDDLEKAREQVGYLVARETKDLSYEDVCKATIETIVENTSDGVIAPLFYMIIGGAPLAMVYKAINTMDSMVGYKNDKYYDYGFVAAKLDDVANYIPARITGLLMVLASFLLGYDSRTSWKILKRDRRNHSSPNAGFPEAATAGALNIQLGGSHIYFGKMVHKPTIGDNIKIVDNEDIKRSIKLMSISSIILLMFMTIIYIIV